MTPLKKIAAGVAALTVIASGATAVGYNIDRPAWHSELQELEEQVASNSRTLALQRWEYLEAKRLNSGLTVAEKAVYCELSALLGFQGVGCR